METQKTISKPVWWAGTILKTLAVLFFAFDAIMKIIMEQHSVDGTLQMGLPAGCIQFLGAYLLVATVLYVYPKTAVLGLLFITAYLGAATAVMYRAGMPGHPYFFPVVFTVVVVVAEFLRNSKLRQVLPLVK